MKSVLVFAALLGVALAGVFQIELTKIQSKRMRMIADGTWPAYLKYKEFLRSSGKAVVSQPANDYDDLEYIGNGTLGTPQQPFLIILDTGSSNLWVPDSTCAACSRKHRYDRTKSSTFVDNGQKWNIGYGDGSNAGGVLAQDTYCFGSTGTTQLCIPNTVFGRATHLSGFNNDATDGILGLAFQTIAVDHVVPPLINAISQKLLDAPIFTVWLTEVGPVNGKRGGVFTYGGLDTTNCGPIIAYQPLSAATYWQFKIAGIGAGSYSSNTGADVISDTGTSFIGGPTGIVKEIATAVGAHYNAANQIYTIGCKATPPDVVITIGTNKYNIKAKNYIVDGGNGQCYFGFFPFDSTGFGLSWILGDPFIRSYCNTYDIGQQRIGFALANH
uniref:Peptidase A1 domain-containing protein n=1 Tax=Plectus sambesii TaxID=2011161 RepID=A0A914WJ38_9BILA